MNSQKKQVRGCNQLSCEERERILFTGNRTRIVISDHQLWTVLGNQRMWKFLYMYIFFHLFLTQASPTWHRNVVSKSPIQMTLMGVSAARVLFVSRSTGGQVHCSGSIIPPWSKVAKEASRAAWGLSAQVCQERAGSKWHSLWVCAQLLNQAVLSTEEKQF